MRALLLILLLLALHPARAEAQSDGATLGVSAVVLAPDHIRVGDEVKIERGPEGRDSISTHLTFTHAARPHLAVAQRPEDPP
ncbi:MAG TPA: hypothetical protein VGB66_02505, partial [Longimicrobium sp.]